MNTRHHLGEYELFVLLAVLALGEKAYGVPIARELEARRGGEVSIGSIYAVLDRLEAKGLVVSTLGDPTPERGGRAKRYFRVTEAGVQGIRETRAVLEKMWRRLPKLGKELA
jgi:PadR family transcriptional regulator PadR